MRAKHLKLVGLIVAVAVLVVVTYAEKSQEVTLPDAVKAVLADLYPNATLEEAKAEEEELTVYEVELEQDEGDIELTLAPDGTVLETETEIALDELDPAVKKAIVDAAEAQGAKVEEVKKEVVEWVVTLKKLDVPEVSYEAELVKNGQEIELEVAADGTMLEQKAQADDDDDQDANQGDDED